MVKMWILAVSLLFFLPGCDNSKAPPSSRRSEEAPNPPGVMPREAPKGERANPPTKSPRNPELPKGR
jgi:hypothetical protein